MSEKTAHSAVLYAEQQLKEEELELFQLSFFGGEPLLRARTIALPIAKHIATLCQQYQKQFHLHFTTNAALLSEGIIKEIKATCPTTSLQIPFDGGKAKHDQVKQTGTGQGVYALTIKNLRLAAEAGLSINVRCNYSDENIDSFEELIKDVRRETAGHEERVAFSLQRIWQVESTKELAIKAERIASIIAEGKNQCNVAGRGLASSFCYADYEASLVLNYNGDLYKCTARDFTPENRIGYLDALGRAICTTDKYSLSSRYFKECPACSILPICTICCQMRNEAPDRTQCPVAITEEDKTRQIRQRLVALYGNTLGLNN